MGRILVHMAVPDAKRAIAAGMSHLSGNLSEHSVRLYVVPGGPSAVWDAANQYNGIWWGASQPFAPQIAQDMLTSGYMLGTESWFVAMYEANGQVIQHNLPSTPSDSSFDAFCAAAGLYRLIEIGGQNGPI